MGHPRRVRIRVAVLMPASASMVPERRDAITGAVVIGGVALLIAALTE